jgi:hypothetical protein
MVGELFWIVCGILTVIIFIAFLLDEPWNTSLFDVVGKFLGSFILGALISVLSVGLITHLKRQSFDRVTEERVVSEVELVALKDNRDIKGSGGMMLFIGSMQIDQNPYYYFMINTEHGMKMEKISVNDAYIKEGDYKPKYVEYKEHSWIHPKYKDSWYYVDDVDVSYHSRYVLYVPTGTVDKSMEIDLE